MTTNFEEKIIFLGVIDNLKDYCNIFNCSFENFAYINESVEPYNILKIDNSFIEKYFGKYKDIDELRQKAIDYFAENIQGKMINIGEYKNIRISSKSRKKYKSFSADKRKLLIVPILLQVLKTAQYKCSSTKYKDRKDNIIIFHYFINEIFINEGKYSVYITIGEDENGNLFYDLDENKKTFEE